MICLFSFLCTGVTLALFHCLGNIPVVKMLLKINFNGAHKALPHNLIILTEILSGPWALLTFRLIRIFEICSFVISHESSLAAVNRLKFGSTLVFRKIWHWATKKVLKRAAFSLQLVTNLSAINSGGMRGILHLFNKLLTIFQ